MRVTEKGQVTIPRNIRRHLGISPGSEVEFAFAKEGVMLRKVEGERGDSAVREVIDHIHSFRGSINLGGMDGDTFYRLLRD